MSRRTIIQQELSGTNGRPHAYGDAGSACQPSGKGPRLRSLRARDLDPLPVDWLWHNYIPRGAITLIDGDPGTGKSQLTIDFAARVSQGWTMPPEAGTVKVAPAGVLLLSAEDDPARTIRPRLDAAAAELNRIVIVDGVNGEKFGRPVILPEDLDLIRDTAKEINAALVVIDPLMAFLTGAVDSHKDSDVRRVLHELKRFAEETRAAVLVIRHLNKMTSVSAALYRGGGSIGIIGAARSGLVVGRHPDDPENKRVLAAVKCNLGPKPPALAFSIEPVGNTSRVGWIGEVDLTADQVIQHGRPGRPPEDIGEALALLQEQLAAGPKPAAEITAAATARGISERKLRRAKKELGVVVRKVGRAGWEWSLPAPLAVQGDRNSPHMGISTAFNSAGQNGPENKLQREGDRNAAAGAFRPPSATTGYIAPDLDSNEAALLADLDRRDSDGPYRGQRR
jgi:hypothetical protein